MKHISTSAVDNSRKRPLKLFYARSSLRPIESLLLFFFPFRRGQWSMAKAVTLSSWITTVNSHLSFRKTHNYLLSSLRRLRLLLLLFLWSVNGIQPRTLQLYYRKLRNAHLKKNFNRKIDASTEVVRERKRKRNWLQFTVSTSVYVQRSSVNWRSKCRLVGENSNQCE